MREVVTLNGYEQAAVYWRERAEAAEAELTFLKETSKGNAQIIAHAMRIPMQPASCLEILMRSAPRAVSKTYLTENMTHTWDFADRVKLADVVICKLRKLLRSKGLPDAIETVWGYGYALSASAARQLVNEVLTPALGVEDSLTFRSPSALKSQSTDKERAVG